MGGGGGGEGRELESGKEKEKFPFHPHPLLGPSPFPLPPSSFILFPCQCFHPLPLSSCVDFQYCRNSSQFLFCPQLQYEIQKRKQQLEETARLKKELLKLARARQAIAHSYDDIPRQYATPIGPVHAGGGSAGNLAMSPRPVPRGIIRPIDDDVRIAELERERERLERACLERDELDQIYDVLPARVGRMGGGGGGGGGGRGGVPPERGGGGERGVPDRGGGAPIPAYPPRTNFSSTEYLAHRQEVHRRHRVDEPLYVNTATAAGWVYDRDLPGAAPVPVEPVPMPHQPPISKRIDSLPSVQGTGAVSAREAREARLSGSVTLPEIYANRSDARFFSLVSLSASFSLSLCGNSHGYNFAHSFMPIIIYYVCK